jgi:nitrogenase molybdenum-iron protein alpha chain
MKNQFTTNDVVIRETRLKTLLTYNGTAAGLVEHAKKDDLKIGKFQYSQCGECQEGCALSVVSSITDTAVVVHAPIGCASGIIGSYLQNQGVASARNKTFDAKPHVVCTNIKERDTVYGGVEKVRKAVYKLKKENNPKAIFITTSCASSIIGDDIASLADELTDELEIPVAVVNCEGFKSRIWSTGWDAGFNAIFQNLVKPPRQKREDIVNVFNFVGKDTFTSLLGTIGLKPMYYPFSVNDSEEIARMSEGAASVTICETLSTYIAAALEKRYGVPQVRSSAPYGVKATDIWLRDLAHLTNRDDIVEEAIAKEHERIHDKFEYYKSKLAGKKIYILAGDSYAQNVIGIARDYDMDIIGVTTYHHDQKTDTEGFDTLECLVDNYGDVGNYNVCNKSPYQIVKLLADLKPDIMLTRHQGLASYGYKMGIPTILDSDSNLGVGYDGQVGFGERVLRAFSTRKLVENIGAHTKLPYTDWWLSKEQNTFQFVKQ